jgi:glycosyltransferase involved in cell wall biosynthesis
MSAVILIPAYRPDSVLAGIVERLDSFDFQVVVVNDGSGEEYTELFRSLEKICTVLHHEKNKGKGEAIRTGLQYINTELSDCTAVGIMDADGQHTPEDMARVIMKVTPDTLVLGCRDIRKMPFRSRVGNSLTCRAFQHLYHLKLSDTQTGMRAFGRDLIPFLLGVDGSRYEYEMNVLISAAQKGIPVREVPIHTIYRDQENSTSHFHIFRDSLLVYKKMILFTLSSLAGFLIDYTLFAVLTVLFPATAAGLLASNVLARLVSGFCNYSINCRVVFHSRRKASTALQYFLLAVGILLLNNLVLMAYTQVFMIPVYLAKLLTEVTLFVISWIVQNALIFRKNQGTHPTGRNYEGRAA